MKNRDNFSEKTKIDLANRAGWKCSFPDCYIPTVAASLESSSAVSNIGVAAHICAAAMGPGARRYDPNMSPSERSSINNGIWLCQTHAKLIDTDEERFTKQVLLKWKEIAEFKAMLELRCGISNPEEYDGILFAEQSIIIDKPYTESMKLDSILLESGVQTIWGKKVTHAIRDTLIELAQNAITHGGATKCNVKIGSKSISILDNGSPYNTKELYKKCSKSGGSLTITSLIDDYSSKIALAYERHGNNNITTIALIKNPSDITEITDCYIEITVSDIMNMTIPIIEMKNCGIIFLFLPSCIPASSAAMLCNDDKLKSHESKNFVFVAERPSGITIKLIRDNFPDAQIIHN